MGQPQVPQPVKLFVGMLSALPSVLDEASRILENKLGPIDSKTDLWPFDFTNYYSREMGSPLWRRFISFHQEIDPSTLKEIKLYTNVLEQDFSSRYEHPLRPVNLDPGYLCLSKVVLATTKDWAHRIYLGEGIYGEVTLHYYQKQFRPSPWTYPDYCTQQYLEFFQELRKMYRERPGGGCY